MRLIARVLLVLAVMMGPGSAEPSRPPGAGDEKPPAKKKVRATAPDAKPAKKKADPDAETEPGIRAERIGGDCRRWERRLPINPVGVPGGLHVGLKTYAETLQLRDYEVVLTFDDGPWPETTPAILDALREACAHATFFLIGKRTRAAPDLARLENEEGHTVGHHSDTHPSFTLRGFDRGSAISDILKGVEADERAVYRDEAYPAKSPHVPFFRFPGFADTPELLTYLDSNNYAVFGTDLWAADWVRMSPDHERKRVLRLLDESPHHNGIILFHDNVRSTAQMLPGLLRELRRRHYTIAHLVYEFDAKPPALTPPLKGWTKESSETERIISRLRVPIKPGAHHAGPPTNDTGPLPGEGLGDPMMEPERR